MGPSEREEMALLAHSQSAQSLSGVSDTTGAVGTYLYSAPEQAAALRDHLAPAAAPAALPLPPQHVLLQVCPSPT